MEPKKLVLNNPFKITSADTDMHGRLRLGALVNLLIQSAINSSNSIGFGFGNLREKHLFWVLSRMTVEIYQTIHWDDEVVVETWPKDLDKILYIRDYHVKDKSGNILASATSGWLAVNMENKRPKIMEGLNAQVFQHLKNKHALSEIPIKLYPVKSGTTYDLKVQYFDVDLNKHVTSTRYIDWMMDTFSLDFHEANYPGKLSVNYLKETLPGENLKITREKSDMTFDFEGVNNTSATQAFRGKINFKAF